ncbi:MAG: hypothetical protein QM737_18540 [Ferruginibacter sp.]
MENSQEFIEKMSAGYSTQSKTANTFWLVLIISSIVALIGRKDENNLIDLPFTLGKVISMDFYSVSLIIISVVAIVFSAAMAQMLRTRMLIQKVIDDLSEKEKYIGKIHIQDFFDSIATPNYTRVAPISQFMLGKNQFFGTGKPNKFLKFFATFFYIILKLTVFGFLYFVPIIAVNRCWINLDFTASNSSIHVSKLLLIFITVLAAISMVILLIGDIKSIARVSRRIMQ